MPADTIKLIGKEYLQKNALKDPEFYSGLSKNEAAERLKKDFEEDRVVIVSGWVLSETKPGNALQFTFKTSKACIPM